MAKNSQNAKVHVVEVEVEDDIDYDQDPVRPTDDVIAQRNAEAVELVTQYTYETPPLQDPVWRGFLRKTVGAIVAAGSTGKSFWALEAALCVASKKVNEALLNLDIKTHGRVAIYNAEDPQEVVWSRINAIVGFLDEEAKREMLQNIQLVPLFGRAKTDMGDDPKFFREMIHYAWDCRLVIFDTLNRFAGSADENSNVEMGKLLKSFERMASITGAGVLLVHHSSKAASLGGTQDKQESARGASAITSNLRWQGYMQSMTIEEAPLYGKDPDERSRYVRYGGAKENYGEKTEEQWYERADRGVLLPVDLKKKQSAGDGKKGTASKAATKKSGGRRYEQG